MGEEVGEDAVGGADVAADVVAGGGAGSGAGGGVGMQAVEHGGDALGIGHFEGAAAGDKVGGFFEFVVVGAEGHGDAVDCGFVDVVDAYTESAAYVGRGAVAVERTE